MAYAEYSTDITRIPKLLEDKSTEHEEADSIAGGLFNQMRALEPRYHAALAAMHEVRGMHALNEVVEFHHGILQRYKRAQYHLELLARDILRLQHITLDPEFQRKLHDTVHLAREIPIEEAEAHDIWETTKESALAELPQHLKPRVPGDNYETDWDNCPPLKPLKIHPGIWATASVNRGGRTWATTFGTPVYILSQSHTRRPGYEARGFYVWGHWRDGEDICYIGEEGLRGLPVHSRGSR